MLREVLTQKGNSPKYLLKSIKKNGKLSMKRFSLL